MALAPLVSNFFAGGIIRLTPFPIHANLYFFTKKKEEFYPNSNAIKGYGIILEKLVANVCDGGLE